MDIVEKGAPEEEVLPMHIRDAGRQVSTLSAVMPFPLAE